MKKPQILLLLATLLVPGALTVQYADAQGTFRLVNNAGTTFRAPVYYVDICRCQKSGNTTNGLPAGTQTYSGFLIGTPFVMELYAGPTNAADSELRPVVTTEFITTTNTTGYFYPKDVIMTNFAPGSYVKCQARAFDTAFFTISRWAQATCAGLVQGSSDSFIVGPLGGQGTNGTFYETPQTRNLRSFCLLPANLPDGILRATILRNGGSNAAPSMSTNVLLAGDNVSLAATGAAAGSARTRFQWNFDGADIGGATNASLNLGKVESAHGGRYRVQATGPDCPGEVAFDISVYPVPSLLHPQLDVNGFFKATATAAPFRTVYFETSTNLNTWTLVSTQALTLWPTCSFNHFFAPPRSPRFLRTRVSP